MKEESPQEEEVDWSVPLAEAVERLVITEDYDPGGVGGPRDCVHTLADGPFMLGAHHDKLELVETMREKGVEDTGPDATAAGYALAIKSYFKTGAALFIAARPSERQRANA